MSQSVSDCPYLRRVGGSVHYPMLGYCERPSVCALRVVSLGEFQTLCITNDYHHCPLYCFGREADNHGQPS
jgi:hypothetical protein